MIDFIYFVTLGALKGAIFTAFLLAVAGIASFIAQRLPPISIPRTWIEIAATVGRGLLILFAITLGTMILYLIGGGPQL